MATAIAKQRNALADITNIQPDSGKNAVKAGVPLLGGPFTGVAGSDPSVVVRPKRHNPYEWKCFSAERQEVLTGAVCRQTWLSHAVLAPVPAVEKEECNIPPAPETPALSKVLVQFKCHQSDFSSGVQVDVGQYVVVQGDRGIDIGVVVSVNPDAVTCFPEGANLTGSILRHATQREVDYWATELKEDEATAVAFCQERVGVNGLDMEIRHAEYQFDKKKLTFYYDARTRIDFVQLLRELYREFGCRIWMEKVRIESK